MSKYSKLIGRVGVFVAILFCSSLMPQVYALEESTGSGGSNAIAVHQLGQTGEGVNVGLILYRNVRTTHEAFTDGNGTPHAFNYDFTGDGNSIFGHDTQLAGIISSRGGAAFPNDVGVAPGADIHCARVINDANDISWFWLRDALKELVETRNCRVIVTGFDLISIDPNGNSIWTILYDYYAYQDGAIFANAAGNEYTDVNIFGDAYNGVTTGGLRLTDVNNQFDYRRVGYATGSGPTTDGRRKPDITAPSESQTVPTSSSNTAWATVGSGRGETSFSMPHTGGAVALLLGLADDTPGPNDNRSEVIKAVLVNSTMPNVKNKAGASTNPADSNNTWNQDRGYGRLDVLRAYQTLNTNEVAPDINIVQERGWAFGTLAQGESNVYTITVTTRCRLITTLTWQRRMEWVDKKPRNYLLDPDEIYAHLADLDMTVYDPNEPNAVFSEALYNLNPSDNLEKCDILLTSPGDYTVVIDNNSTNGESADYGFAFELHPVPLGDLPPFDYVVNYSDLSSLTTNWLSETSDLDWLLVPNGIVDFADFAKFADSWLQNDPFYYQSP